MSSLVESLENGDGERYIDDVIGEHLEYYTRQLVDAARDGTYDRNVRNRFLVAVGAAALRQLDWDRLPLFQDTTCRAIEAHGALSLVEAHDAEMPFWDHGEWALQVKKVFQAAIFQPGTKLPEDDGAIGYCELLEALRAGRAFYR